MSTQVTGTVVSVPGGAATVRLALSEGVLGAVNVQSSGTGGAAAPQVEADVVNTGAAIATSRLHVYDKAVNETRPKPSTGAGPVHQGEELLVTVTQGAPGAAVTLTVVATVYGYNEPGALALTTALEA